MACNFKTDATSIPSVSLEEASSDTNARLRHSRYFATFAVERFSYESSLDANEEDEVFLRYDTTGIQRNHL